jgi:uncharacterized protein YwqG
MKKIIKDALIELSNFKKPAIPFKLDKLLEDNILGSKIHGTPYWEKGGKIPLNTSGEPMELMAQINLSKMPHLPNFPKEGILQFFLSLGDTFGMNFDKCIDHKYNRVIYWPNPDMANYSPYPQVDIIESPSNIPLSIEADEIKLESCFIADQYNYDYLLENNLKVKFPNLDTDELFDCICGDEEYEELIGDNGGSKMGGFAYFTQDDPRGYENSDLYKTWGLRKEEHKEIIVLLQLDSDHEEMMWGDCGVANWHILKEDLEKLDFSRVFFTWDCC